MGNARRPPHRAGLSRGRQLSPVVLGRDHPAGSIRHRGNPGKRPIDPALLAGRVLLGRRGARRDSRQAARRSGAGIFLPTERGPEPFPVEPGLVLVGDPSRFPFRSLWNDAARASPT